MRTGRSGRQLGSLLSARASVLWIGFTGLLLLMAVMAIDATTSLRDVEVTTAALRTESRKRDGLLDQLRADIYRSATVVRDYLLELDAARAESQKAELELLRTRIDDTLRIYEQKLPDTEKDGFPGSAQPCRIVLEVAGARTAMGCGRTTGQGRTLSARRHHALPRRGSPVDQAGHCSE